MKDYKELKIWQKAHEFTRMVYKATLCFPQHEQYGLTSQIRRASVSIPSNIAEGCGRRGDVELARFFEISLGSANEVDYQLLLAKDIGYLPEDKYNELAAVAFELRKMLSSFIRKLRGGK